MSPPKNSTNGAVTYAYDENSNLTGAKSNTPEGYDQSYDYDVLNRMDAAYYGQDGVDPAAYGVASYGYDAIGNMVGSGYANGVGHQYSYSVLNRLKELTVGKMTTGLDPPSIATIHQQYTYTLNRAGHRTQITEQSGRSINHVFDKLYRLKSETITGDTNAQNGIISYTHDRVGNRLSRTSSVSAVSSQSQSYSDNDWLTNHSQDENGNTISSPSSDYTLITDDGSPVTGAISDVYDFRNKLIRRSYSGGRVIHLSYDAEGNRVSKGVFDASLGVRDHHYLVDTNNHTGYAQVVEESDASGLVTRVNLYGHDLVATNFLTEGYQRYYQYDGLGSVRALSDSNGDITDEYTYDAFGILLSSSGDTPNQYLYTGEQWDADLGMYFLRARYNNVQTGRLHNMDTYEGRNGEPMTLHKYMYAHANPVSYIDPSGNIALAAEFSLSFNLSLSLNTSLNLVAGAYLGSYLASRRWAITPWFELRSELGPHFFLYALRFIGTPKEQYRYDYFETGAGAKITVENLTASGFVPSGFPISIPILMSDTGYKVWDRLVAPGRSNLRFSTEKTLYGCAACFGWTVGNYTLASVISLMPF